MKKLIIAYLFTITNVFAAPPTYFNGELQTNTYIQNIKAPNYQTTPLGGIDRRLETGNLNELQNPSFEHTAVTTGWTISNATSSSSTTRIEGLKSLSLALTGALSLSQSSTINAAQKSGVQMVASIWINSSDVSDLQLCSLKNGSEDKCTVTGGYVQGSGWRQLTVSFLGDSTSNGLKLKSTGTTGTVLVDQAYVGIGSPIVDFTPDMEFSAKVSITGVVSHENTDWINGNCSAGGGSYTCPINTGVFSVVPNCVATSQTSGGSGLIIGYISSSSSATSLRFIGASGSNPADQPFTIICQKQGADYKTSKAYVASGSLVLNTTVYSAKVSAAGAVSDENTDFISGSVTISTGAITGTWTSGIFTVAPNCVGVFDVGSGATTPKAINLTTTVSGFSGATFSSTNKESGAFQLICQKQGADYQAAFNPVIVGSFQGYNETPGTSRVETFKYNFYGANPTTTCSSGTCTTKQIGTNVSKVERTALGTYLNTFSKTYSAIQCVINGVSGASSNIGYSKGYYCESCNSLSMLIANANNTALSDGWGFVDCQGIPQ